MLDRLKKNDNSRKNFHKFENWRKIFLYHKIVSINTSSFSVENYFDRVTFHDLSITTLRFLGSRQRKEYPRAIFLLFYDDKIIDDNLFQTKISFKFHSKKLIEYKSWYSSLSEFYSHLLIPLENFTIREM